MKKYKIKNIDCHNALAITKNTQSGRCLLPESGADAPAVFSTVYTDSTSAKNRQADVPQHGRSMIEMLGVLAIIGVLSVGGIAGYSKAMTKYRINKTIEQITLIAGNIRSFFAPQGNYTDLGCPDEGTNGCDVVKKAHLIPDEMLTFYKIDDHGLH
ncbi:MAG: type II secretion system protein [Alphaproteobacteria bacterium]|nr:type II secretion system protein [Alphaproteobacteria bacterium]